MKASIYSLLLAGSAFGCASSASSLAPSIWTDTPLAAEPTPLIVTAAPAPTESPATTGIDASESALSLSSSLLVFEPASLAAEPAPWALPAAPAAPAAAAGDKANSYFMAKLGYYGADVSGLDGGWMLNLAWARYFTRLLALELELGYFSDSGGGLDLWGVPLMINGRLSLPVWILELYGGLGVGGIYYDADFGPFKDDGFLLGANAFLGADFALADTLTLGLEGKYYVTEEIDNSNQDLNAYALLVTLGWRR